MEMATQILIAEDDPDINRLLGRILEKEGYQVTSAFSGSEARLLLKTVRFDLIVLDLMLPGATGEELVEEIRKNSTTPILVVSAKGQEDKLNVLKMGADDFISKPFDVNEVAVRVYSLLRRSRNFSENGGEKQTLSLKNLEIDLESREVRVSGKPLTLTAREYDILVLLMRYPNKVFTRQNIFETVWGGAYLGDDNTINVHISNLRSKIQKLDDKEEYISTIWGVGFKAAKPRE
ncbi:MAG TPA: response regulator transcription factor [Candidatus Merdivicinus excrementipullorum]|uniref:Stage 0 sporulation protein A homolog n=1 Tax=Candidatus Merdivicinus excrementipullorum TaxID=2840867 RepID=A0A9D1K005_9FIRM|nr:response regulator transcription factor [Candidatus Merdivicinus excrementipullorum]